MEDLNKWLEEHRATDKSDWETIEIELQDDELENFKESAKALGMDFNEYYNYAVVLMLEKYDKSN